MRRLSRICAIAVLLLISAEAALAVNKFIYVGRADAVVVGQIKLSSFFMWFDGLHINGAIAPTEVLYGSGEAGRDFAFHLVLGCAVWDGCPYRYVWKHWSESKENVTQKRIYALVKGPGSSWTADEPYAAFIYNLADREYAIAVLKARKQREHDRQKP